MTVVFAAFGSIVLAVAELSIAPHFVVLGARPHPVLLGVVFVTMLIGIEPGLVAAFLGGLGLDVLTGRPIGASSFALLLCAAITAMLALPGPRVRSALAVGAVFPVSLIFSFLLFGIMGTLGTPIPTHDPIGLLLPGAVLDLVIALVLVPFMALARRHRRVEPRVTW